MDSPNTVTSRRRSETPASRATAATRNTVIAPLWTIHDVSTYLGVPVQTLYSWRARNFGPRARRVGKHLRYRPGDVESWVDALDTDGPA
jgi:predicted DNA-binding transcriptional regulator AlpA